MKNESRVFLFAKLLCSPTPMLNQTFEGIRGLKFFRSEEDIEYKHVKLVIRWKPRHDSLYEVSPDHIISEPLPLEEINSKQRWQTFSISGGQLAPSILIPTWKVTDRARLESASGFWEQTSKQDNLLETRRLGLAQSLEPCKPLTSDCTE